MTQILVHNEAELELWQAVDYYESKHKGLGLDFAQEVSRAFQNLQMTLLKWPVKKFGARRLLLPRFPYAVYYFKHENQIWVVAVAHTKRKPYYWKKRL